MGGTGPRPGGGVWRCPPHCCHQRLPGPARTPPEQTVWRQRPPYCPFLYPASHGEPSLLLKGTRVVRSRGGGVAGTGLESFGALRATPDPRSSRRSWSTTRGLSLRKYLAQQPAGPPQTAVRGSVGTGRGSSVSVGAFPHRACLWKWFPISGLCASVCVSSCEGTG